MPQVGHWSFGTIDGDQKPCSIATRAGSGPLLDTLVPAQKCRKLSVLRPAKPTYNARFRLCAGLAAGFSPAAKPGAFS
jgi:hypothetical protein